MIDKTIPVFEHVYHIEPVIKARPRITKKGWAYTPKKTKDFETEIKALTKFKGELLTGSLTVFLAFHFTKPKNPSKPYPRGDLDNYIKSLTDALNGIVYADDSQITHITATKQYSQSKPKIEIVILHSI